MLVDIYEVLYNGIVHEAIALLHDCALLLPKPLHLMQTTPRPSLVERDGISESRISRLRDQF